VAFVGAAICAAVSAPARAAGARVSFFGFTQFGDGSCRLFVHLTQSPGNVSKSANGSEVTLRLEDTDVGVRNNKNPLALEHFGVILLRAQLFQRENAVELVMKLRSEVEVTHSVQRRGDGEVMILIDLPALTPR